MNVKLNVHAVNKDLLWLLTAFFYVISDSYMQGEEDIPVNSAASV